MVTTRHLVVVAAVAAGVAGVLAAWRLHDGLAMVGDSGSYLAGASGFGEGRWFRTPLVPSFSEHPLLDTVADAGWSPYADFGLGLPVTIAIVAVAAPLRIAAGAVNVVAIAAIAAGVVVGPWTPRRHGELWARAVLAVALSCWPILRFTGVGVLSEPLFCAAAVGLAIVLARMRAPTPRWLLAAGALAVLMGLTRFVGPAVAVVAAVLLVQRGLSWRKGLAWGALTAAVPVVAAAAATGPGGSRVVRFHDRGLDDVFFLARGVGGWFEAGMGDQTATLLRASFDPSLVDWAVAAGAMVGAVAVVWWWLRPPWTRTRSQLEPALVLATALVVVVVPSMFLLDAILKLENRILMPSGVLVIGAGGWWLARRARTLVALGGVALWAVVATHPWAWLERPSPSRPTALTDAVAGLDVPYVVTNLADHVWWHTGVPAAYLPTGYHNRSERVDDPVPIVAALPCALARTGGAIVIDAGALVVPAVADQLAVDVAAGRYEAEELAPGVVAYWPTGLDCASG